MCRTICRVQVLGRGSLHSPRSALQKVSRGRRLGAAIVECCRQNGSGLRSDTKTMRFTLPAGQFRDALSQVRSTIPSTPTLIAYSGVLIAALSDTVRVVGSDGETTLSCTLPALGVEPGQMLVQPKPLSAFLQTLPAACSVSVGVDGNGDVEVTIEGLSPYTFRPLTASYPMPAAVSGKSMTCDLSRLPAALSAVRPAVSRENLAVQVVSTSSGLALFATDTFRLCRAVLPEAGFGDFRGVLPLPVLERAARSDPATVSIDARTRMVTFESPSLSVSSRLLATPFPAVEAVIDAIPTFSVTFDPREVKASLARLLSVADQSAVRIRLEGNLAHLSASTADTGSGKESVSLRVPVAAPFEVLVKGQYLRDAVATFDCDTVAFAYSGSFQPLYLSASEPFSLLQIVMPVRS